MKRLLIASTFLVPICLVGGCSRVVQDTGMDERRFIDTFFGSTFPTNQTQLEFIYKAGVRGFVAVALVEGPQQEIRTLLASRGVESLRQGEEKEDVAKLLRLRVSSLAKEKASTLLPSHLAGTEYRWQTITSSNELCEYYVASDYSHFIFVDLRR